MKMTENGYFTFYENFWETLLMIPEDARMVFVCAIIEYGLYGQEPDFAGLEWAAAAFKQIRDAIDNQRARRLSHAGNSNAAKNKPKQNETNENKIKQTKTKRNKAEGENERESEREREKECEYDKGLEERGQEEDESGKGKDERVKKSAAPPSAEAAERIFEAWKSALLPCQGGDFGLFLERDWKEAEARAKNTPLADIEQAAKNFASVVSDPKADPFMRGKQYTLGEFLRSKFFEPFLPCNFRREKYEDRPKAADLERAERERREAERKRREDELFKDAPKKCPDCGKPLVRDHAALSALCRPCKVWYERTAKGWFEFRSGG